MTHCSAQIDFDARNHAQSGSVYVLTFLIQHSLADSSFSPFVQIIMSTPNGPL